MKTLAYIDHYLAQFRLNEQEKKIYEIIGNELKLAHEDYSKTRQMRFIFQAGFIGAGSLVFLFVAINLLTNSTFLPVLGYIFSPIALIMGALWIFFTKKEEAALDIFISSLNLVLGFTGALEVKYGLVPRPFALAGKVPVPPLSKTAGPDEPAGYTPGGITPTGVQSTYPQTGSDSYGYSQGYSAGASSAGSTPSMMSSNTTIGQAATASPYTTPMGQADVSSTPPTTLPSSETSATAPVPPQAQTFAPAAPVYDMAKPGENLLCGYCGGTIKQGLNIIRCGCGTTFHDVCGQRFGKCNSCSAAFPAPPQQAAAPSPAPAAVSAPTPPTTTTPAPPADITSTAAVSPASSASSTSPPLPATSSTVGVPSTSPAKAKKQVCAICHGAIKQGLTVVECKCGNTFHQICANRAGECPVCYRKL